jgi:hypothetical protein
MRLLKVRRISRNAADSTALAKQDARIDDWAKWAEEHGKTVVCLADNHSVARPGRMLDNHPDLDNVVN